MRKKVSQLLLIAVLIACIPVAARSQADSAIKNASNVLEKISDRMLKSSERKYSKLHKMLAKNTAKTLAQLEKEETGLQQQAAGKDSAEAQRLLATTQQKYAIIRQQLSGGQAGTNAEKGYLPGFDSMQTMLKFLDKPASQIPGIPAAKLDQVKALSAELTNVQTELTKAADLTAFIKERKQALTDQFAKLGIGNSLGGVNKQVYYYQQQLAEYKTMLNDPDKLQEKALALLRQSTVFKNFFTQNSQFAALFGSPGGGTSAPGVPIPGLQTRAVVQQQMAAGLGATGVDPSQYLSAQVGQAQSQMNVLKDKVNRLGGGGSDMAIPDFAPNKQKTKSFLRRIEYGINIQSQRTTGLLPVTSDIALTAGYKLNDKSTIGIGAGYKMGWGNNISNIHITNQGLSLRSYLDIKLKGSIWVSGGYEGNYQQEFTRIVQLQNINAWQRSGLIGLTKKYKLGKKAGNMQLLWDFLSYSQIPQAPALKFRVGYTL